MVHYFRPVRDVEPEELAYERAAIVAGELAAEQVGSINADGSQFRHCCRGKRITSCAGSCSALRRH
jgi:hypothetical protein